MNSPLLPTAWSVPSRTSMGTISPLAGLEGKRSAPFERDDPLAGGHGEPLIVLLGSEDEDSLLGVQGVPLGIRLPARAGLRHR